MKKHIFVLSVLVAFILASGMDVDAQQDAKKEGKVLTPDFEKWSEVQITSWEDSVRKVLYPEAIIGITDAPSKSKPVEGRDINSTASLSLTNSSINNSYDIDRTKTVGEISISSSTSPTGAILYNVPIDIYPGIRGFQPQLAFVYNNQASDGVMGNGWNISGLSSISRGGLSIYYDSKSQGISMTKSDAFMLDGARLIKLSETSTQIKYETEQGFMKVNATLSGNVVRYFEVYYPNGCKGVFGYTGNYSDYQSYPITSLSDIKGNTIYFNYTYSNNRYTISSITYNSASVEFQYTTRSYPVVVYSGGLKITEDKLLQKVVCKFGSTILRTYELSYLTKRYNHLLSQIGCVAGSSSFNPLRFFYGEGNTAYSYTKAETQLYEWYTNAQPGQLRVAKGKFDYGTEDDGLISLPNKNSYWQHYRNSTMFRHSQNRYDNYYDGTEKIFLYAGLNSSWASPMPNLTTEKGFVDIFCANTDGKYEEELIKVNNVVSGNYDQLTFKVYAPNLYYGLGYKYTRTFNFSTVLTDSDGGKSIHPKFYHCGDFNGDGRMEVLAVSCHNPFGWTDKTSKCYLFDLESNTKLYEGYAFPYKVDFVGSRQGDADAAFQNTDRLFAFDYDGDGKTDICLINDQGTYIYSFNVSGSSYSMSQVASYTGLKKADLAGRELMIGEFNGDGKPDFLISPKVSASDWAIYYSKGNGQFEKASVSVTYRGSSYKYLVQDVNGDGMTDVIEYSTSGYYTYLARTGGFSYDTYTSFSNSSSVIVPTNINSRDYYHQLVALKDGKVTRFSYPRNDTKEKLLTGMVNSLGVVNKNYYMMLNESSYYYTKGYGAVYPYENFQGPLFVPISTEQYFNGQRNEYNTYTYDNAVIHKQGLGFRGFGKITTYDNIRGRTMTKEYDPFNYCMLKSEESPFVKNTNTYSVSVLSNKLVRINLTSRSLQDKLKNLTTSYSYQYDAYGNPTLETINYGGGITTTTSKTFSNNTNESGYLLGFLINMTKTTNRNGTTWSERVQVPAYSGGLPTVRVQYSNGNQVAYEVFSYDSKGNVTQQSLKNYTSSNNLITRYEYDTYGRVTKETSPMGFNATYEYNSTNGALSVKKNHKGQASTFGYDAFGRVSSVSYPEGTVKTTSFSWTGAGTNGLYCVTTTTYGEPTSKTYYDAYNRETRGSQVRFNGVEGHIDRIYDNYGRLQKMSLPFTGSMASSWSTYGYDNYDRPSYVNEPSGKRTTYSYSGNSTTTTKEGIASTQTFDTQGNLMSVSDPAGTITYNLRPDGQPNSIIAPGNVSTSFSYDNYGRQLSMTDPSVGTQSYQYDAAGNLSRETDANGKAINMVYDPFNRLITKTCPEFSSTHTYNAEGLLASTTTNNGTSAVFTYDGYGRINTEKQTSVDGKWFQKTYSYSYRNIASVGYTSQTGSIVTENLIYTNGHLSEIKLNNQTSIWKLNAENSLGQPTSLATGALSRSYGYDAYGLPTSRTAGSLQNLSYSFDATKGNLTYRKDNRYGIQENFTYDNLNRLTGYAGKAASYDIKGNITQKTDIGTFYYNTSGKPYAISGVNTSSSAIPQRNQSVTYTSFKRPNVITEGAYNASFVYNADGERVKMELKKNGSSELKRYYLSNQYELDEGVAGTKEKLYLGGDYYSASAVYVKQGTGSWQVYFICRDYLGSITHIANSSGSLVQELSYDAWGRLRNPSNQTVYNPDSEPVLFLGRGYTGHEHLTMFGLVNMNARLYDPVVGRFLAPDPNVQSPDMTQNFNRYSYALNNPLRYIDQNGEFFFIPILVGMAYGALIGAGVAAISYTITAAITNSWSWSGFGSSVLFGAVGGAIGGGFGALGGLGVFGSFGNTLGYNMLSQVSNSVLTNAMFGNEMTWGSMAGMVAGGVAGSFLPSFNAVKGGAFKNAISEIGFNAGKGTITGLASGLVQAGVDKNSNAILQNTLGGAIGGASTSILNIATMGAAYKPKSTYGDFGKESPLYRRGTFITKALFTGSGVAIGRNLVTNTLDENKSWAINPAEYNEYLRAHETAHYAQQREMGFAGFYGRTAIEYMKYGLSKVYTTFGTLEYAADRYALRQVGYYFSNGVKYTY